MSQRRRLILVSELFYPEQTSTGYFLTEIAKGLSSEMDITVLCAQPSYSERGIIAPRREEWEGLSIRRLRATHFDKDRLVLRALNVLSFTLSCFFALLIHLRKGDQLIIVTNPPTLVPFAALVSRLKSVPAHLIVHDVYPDLLVATGFLRSDSFLYRLLNGIMRFALRSYKNIVVLGEDMQKLIAEKSDKPIPEIPIIRNWSDCDEILPLKENENPFSSLHGLAGKVSIQFSGNIGRTHDIETVLMAADALRDESDLRFMFIGYGGKAKSLANRLELEDYPNVRFLPRQPRELLGPMLSSATAVVIPFEPTMLGISVPSRMYNVLAAGTPIIAMADEASELALTVTQNDVGWLLRPGDSHSLVNLVRFLCTAEGQEEVRIKGLNARNAACSKYHFYSVLKNYNNLLK